MPSDRESREPASPSGGTCGDPIHALLERCHAAINPEEHPDLIADIEEVLDHESV